jgi:hypothetical protein
MNEVFNYGSMFDTRFNIISLYIPWGDAPQCFLQDSIVNMIYGNGSIPMITWEPWGSLQGDLQKINDVSYLLFCKCTSRLCFNNLIKRSLRIVLPVEEQRVIRSSTSRKIV